MNENMIVEAVRSVGAGQSMQGAFATQNIDPAAVEQFQSAMATDAVTPTMQVPFLSEISKSWTVAHENNQAILHRIRALSELKENHYVTAPEMIELQYEVANLAFQQEVVAKVADKASQAAQTLIKNQ